MRCVAGHQPNLYPYGGFFAKAASVERFVIADVTQYVKKEYHNRNRVKLADGAAHWLSIPVRTAGRFTQQLREVELEPHANWQKVHLRTLEVAYGKCPHFERYYPSFRELLSRDWGKLVDFNGAVILRCMELLGIETPVAFASALGCEGRKSELILDICRKTGGDAYLHGVHGRDYADFEMLEREGVRNCLQTFTALPYAQPWGPFVPNLCILDILFNCGPDSLGLLMRGSKVHDARTGEPIELGAAPVNLGSALDT